MLVGDNTNSAIRAGLVPQLLKQGKSPPGIIEELFIRCVSRKPTSDELAAMLDLVGDEVEGRAAYEDILWSLLNSTEFSFNR